MANLIERRQWMPLAAIATALELCVMCATKPPSQAAARADRRRCGTDDAYLQVLGSGGPMHGEGRRGSSYVVWLSGRPAIVVDMGADTPAALAQAGAMPASADIVLVSHLHPDHVSGLPDFLWGEKTAGRRRALVIAGPSGGGDDFPSTPEFLKRLIGKDGAFPALSSLYDGVPFAVPVTTLTISDSTPHHVVKHDDVAISALSVPHGRAPALAYRLDSPRFRIVFAGDQSGLNPSFIAFASGADLLVLHAMVSERAKNDPLADIVGLPTRFGSLARASQAKRVLLSHFMGQPGAQTSLWSLANIQGVLNSFRSAYAGPVTLASDLMCVTLSGVAAKATPTHGS